MGTDGSWAFRETGPLASPQLKVNMKLHTETYDILNLSPPHLLYGGEPRPITNNGVADTGAMMDISSLAMARSLGVDINTLLPVQARVFGATREAEIVILGAMFVEISHPTQPSLNTVRMFYVASNVSRTYLSLATLKALGVVEEDFPAYLSCQRWQPPASPRSQCQPAQTQVWLYLGRSHAPVQPGPFLQLLS